MDLSLRANPENYIDRDRESEKILKRIDSDTSTVIGISGLRGAGKSSLAHKALKLCKDSGYFTLLIHSPTGYESREFLITIYSRICESVIRKLEHKFGVDNTLEGKATSIIREIKSYIRAILLGAFILVMALAGVYYYAYSKQMEKREELQQAELEKEIDEEIISIKTELEKYNTDLQRDTLRIEIL